MAIRIRQLSSSNSVLAKTYNLLYADNNIGISFALHLGCLDELLYLFSSPRQLIGTIPT